MGPGASKQDAEATSVSKQNSLSDALSLKHPCKLRCFPVPIRHRDALTDWLQNKAVSELRASFLEIMLLASNLQED